MIDTGVESKCESCIHQEICKYRDLYLQAVEAVQNVTVNLQPITELDFLVQPIEVRCKHRGIRADIPTFRSGQV